MCVCCGNDLLSLHLRTPGIFASWTDTVKKTRLSWRHLWRTRWGSSTLQPRTTSSVSKLGWVGLQRRQISAILLPWCISIVTVTLMCFHGYGCPFSKILLISAQLSLIVWNFNLVNEEVCVVTLLQVYPMYMCVLFVPFCNPGQQQPVCVQALLPLVWQLQRQSGQWIAHGTAYGYRYWYRYCTYVRTYMVTVVNSLLSRLLVNSL